MQKVALVTGGWRGIGAAIAAEFNHRNYRVYATSRTMPKEKAANEIQTLIMDVTQPESIDQAFAQIMSEVGQIDVVVNNAGIGVFKPMPDISDQEFFDVINTNLIGAFYVAKRAVSAMQKRGGRIINIGSIVDHKVMPENAAYAASKAGLAMVSDVINEDCAKQNIRSTHISLGATWTDIWQGRQGFSREDMLDLKLVAETIVQIAETPLSARIDRLSLYPSKGVL
jgi:NAD(P)-dependent dehydrogenase (short-subunit alcohol dehydrogenase family)